MSAGVAVSGNSVYISGYSSDGQNNNIGFLRKYTVSNGLTGSSKISDKKIRFHLV